MEIIKHCLNINLKMNFILWHFIDDKIIIGVKGRTNLGYLMSIYDPLHIDISGNYFVIRLMYRQLIMKSGIKPLFGTTYSSYLFF